MPRYTAGEVLWKVSSDSSQLQRDLKKTDTRIKGTQSSFSKFGKTIGAIVSAGAIIALGKQALKTGIDFNKGMANVGSLIPGQVERLDELKEATKALSIETGKPLADLSAGLYQVVSAYGDNEDTIENFNTTVKASKAGVASTTDALNLLSAVTKAYGDTSSEAQKNVSDMAFETIRLGQTSFPELASAIQLTTDRSQALDVSQQELFATFATLTGVTGNASRVATQMRSALVALDSPTDTLTNLYKKLGVESGKALIEQNGLQGAFKLIQKDSDETGISMNDYLGRVEAVTAVSVLAGSQSEVFAQKLLEIQDASGATQKAFDAQTQGINKSGFALETLKTTWNVFQSEIYDLFAPALEFVVNGITNLIEGFGKLPDPLKAIIIGLVGTAGLAPAVIKIGAILKTSLLPILVSPAGIIIALGALATALIIAGVESKSFETQLENQAESLDVINNLIERNIEIGEKAGRTQKLIDKYEELNKITNKSAQEQFELKKVIEDIGKELPGVITEWDEYGNAVEINSEKAIEATARLLRIQKVEQEEIVERLKGNKALAISTKQNIEAESEQARKRNTDLANINAKLRETDAVASELSNRLQSAFDLEDESEIDKVINEVAIAMESLGLITQDTVDGLNAGFVSTTALTTALDEAQKAFDDSTKALARSNDETNTFFEQSQQARDAIKALEEAEAKLKDINDQLAESQNGVNNSIETGGKGAESAKKSWSEYAKEILEVSGNTGKEFADNFADNFEAILDRVRAIAQRTGEELDMTESLQEQKDAINDVLDQLLAIPPDLIDEVFTIDDSIIQNLVDQYKVLDLQLKELEASKEKQNELDSEKEKLDEAEIERVKNIGDVTNEYILKLQEMGLTELELIEIERELALAKVEGNQEGIDAVNEYYDALSDSTAYDQQKENMKKVFDFAQSMYGSLKSVVDSYYDFEISKAEGNSEKIAELKRKQFNINKLFSATETAIAGAQAIIEIHKSLSAIPYVGPILATTASVAMGALTATQVGFILSQKPPAFESGGIVPGTQYRGDNVNADLNSREAVMTLEDQQEMFDLLRSKKGSGITLIQNNLLNLDSQENLERAARILYPYLQQEGKRIG